MQDDELELHRRFGGRFNNEVWDRLDAGVDPAGTQRELDLVLYGAYASLRHWMEAGGPNEYARGEHLVARAAVAVGLNEVSLRHARRCLELVQKHPEVMADFDAPLAHEAVARALAAVGDGEGAWQHLTQARQLIAQIADPEDREVLEMQLAQEPWFGLS